MPTKHRRRRRRLGSGVSTEEALVRIMSRVPYLREGAEVEIAARFRLKVTAESLALDANYAAYLAPSRGSSLFAAPTRIAVTPNPSQLIREVVVALRREALRQKNSRPPADAPGQLKLPGSEVDHADD